MRENDARRDMERKVNIQSSPTFVAAVMLKALLLFVPVSAVALSEDVQKIGVPHFLVPSGANCFNAVLSPDKNQIYTVREGVLTRYAINPLARISSVALEWERFGVERQALCRILITADMSKLIVGFSRKIFLLDANTGRILNIAELNETGRSMDAATLNGSELILLDQNIADATGGRDISRLTIRDANTLESKREIRDLKARADFVPSLQGDALYGIHEKLYLSTAWRVVVFSSKTYDPELTMSYSPNGKTPMISISSQRLYFPNVTGLEIKDHMTKKTLSYKNIERDRVLVFDQKTRTTSFVTLDDLPRADSTLVDLNHRYHTSVNREYALLSQPSLGAIATLIDLNTGEAHRFLQYESGEAILVEVQSRGTPTNFKLTPGARKHLMMKNETGNIVPINDATFAKYHRAGK